MFKLNQLVITAVFILSYSSILYAENDRVDYDIDDDGLIEINDIGDLTAIPGSFATPALLYGEDKGCPNEGCNGYELTQNLDLRSHARTQNLSNSIFEGNGYTLYNVMSSGYPTGLFSELINSEVRNVNIAGELSRVNGDSQVGGIAGIARNSIIHNCSVNTKIRGIELVGGIVGYAADSIISNSHFYGELITFSPEQHIGHAGGIAGAASNTEIIASSMRGVLPVTNSLSIGAILGHVYPSETEKRTKIIASYAELYFDRNNALGLLVASEDTSNIEIQASYSVIRSEQTQVLQGTLVQQHVVDSGVTQSSVIKLTEEQLKCPVSANNNDCSEYLLYSNWDTLLDAKGEPIWQFGTNQELPTIAAMASPKSTNNSNQNEFGGAVGAFSLLQLFSILLLYCRSALKTTTTAP